MESDSTEMQKIPKEKGKEVLVVLEEKKDCREEDSRMLNMLREEYETVYIWIKDREKSGLSPKN